MTRKDIRAGAMMSKVGNPQVYEANEQRTSPPTDHNPPKKINETKEQSYFDIEDMDERKIGETLVTAWKQRPYDESKVRSADPRVDPLGPATVHGNKPSRGAKIDAELKAEEEEELKNKKA
ncbi:hypothetical protein ID866_9220 [Astraeus odoratus]|nr:hypothetical protein ID866_9220 [Astraeus odoratus]